MKWNLNKQIPTPQGLSGRDSNQQPSSQQTPTTQVEPEIYETMYEAHAQLHADETVIGDLSFGVYELALLKMAGLKRDATVVDLGCGVGRLACELVPWLTTGHYIGTDVAPSILARAEPRLRKVAPSPTCKVTWIKQVGTTFAVEDQSVDMFCAFSVFTHIENEDSYNFLKDARRAIKPNGRFVYSCMNMDQEMPRNLFKASAELDFAGRWTALRQVITSVDLMDAIAKMAGWKPLRWDVGDKNYIPLDNGELVSIGQSTCILEPA